MRFRSAWLLVPAFTGAALTAGAQDVPATGSTIVTDMEQSPAGEFSQLIYVMNHSSHAIIVTSLRLMECENVQGGCGTRRMKERVPPGGRVLIQRVRPRSPDLPSGFRYTFTWEEEPSEGPTAKDVEKDKAALVIDTVIVMPKLLDIKTGETIDLTQVLRFKAMNAAGQELPRIYFHTEIALGANFIELDGTKLTGKSPGTAALLIRASTVQGPVPPSKGASRILILVTP
jgi:hypothetical protein